MKLGHIDYDAATEREIVEQIQELHRLGAKPNWLDLREHEIKHHGGREKVLAQIDKTNAAMTTAKDVL